jgi:hypothetical protein
VQALLRQQGLNKPARRMRNIWEVETDEDHEIPKHLAGCC